MCADVFAVVMQGNVLPTTDRQRSMCDTASVTISRRRFLALSATFTVAACSSDGTDLAPPESAGSTTSTEPPTTDAPTNSTPEPTTAPSPDSTTTVAAPESAPVELSSDPFVFGVASGDPDPQSVVIWTRLGNDLSEVDTPDGEIPIDWFFAGDSGLELAGTATTSPAIGYSLHVIVPTTEPGTYSFSAGGFTSPTGRTAPINPAATEFRIAAASCQHYETGFYAAHGDIAAWEPDLVVFLGDFMYEGAANELGGAVVRQHEGPEPTDLDGYRARYATYLSDPQLQASRAAAPWLAIWDDHEVENNYAGVISENDDDPDIFAPRRAQAYQVWWENTPTRLDPPSEQTGTDQPYVIHRGLDVGEFLRISALDGRQFRDRVVSREILQTGPPVDGWDDPDRTMLGAEQEAWVADRFATSTTLWNCLAQQTVLSDTRVGDIGAILNYDQWDGYHPARERLLAGAPPNFVTLTGDIHLAGVAEIGPIGDPVGIEFITTAISSTANVDPALAEVVLSIPSIVDGDLVSRGYTRHTVTTDAWTAEYRQVVDIADADSAVTTWKTFRVDAGIPAVNPV